MPDTHVDAHQVPPHAGAQGTRTRSCPWTLRGRLLADLLAEVVDVDGAPKRVIAPATGAVLATLPQYTEAGTRRAFDRARRAQQQWAQVPVSERVRVARRFSKLLCRHRRDLLGVVQLETGKARLDAAFEMGEAVMSTAQHARTAAGLLDRRRHRGMLRGLSTVQEIRHPKGVVSVIIPWNFPLALAVCDALPALIAGNAVILKPDNQTALSALLLSRLLREAGLPASVFQVVPGPVEDIGDVVIEEADYVAFTGSTDTGRRIGAKAGAALIGCSLELGGKNPMIVLADADLDRVIAALPQAVCLNAGQVCMAIERIYVHSSRYEEFISRAVDRFATLPHLRLQVTDPAIREALTPDYNFFCKRPTFSNTYFPAFNRDNVDLVTAPIDHINSTGIVTEDGHARAFDVIVLATGFKLQEEGNFPAFPIYGRDGVEQGAYWREHGYESYDGITVHGYPNMFGMNNPFSFTGLSFFYQAESQMAHISRVIGELRKRHGVVFEVKPHAQRKFVAKMDSRAASTVWFRGSCATANSYYFNAAGQTRLARLHPTAYVQWRSKHFPLSDYRFDTATDPLVRDAHRQAATNAS